MYMKDNCIKVGEGLLSPIASFLLLLFTPFFSNFADLNVSFPQMSLPSYENTK